MHVTYYVYVLGLAEDLEARVVKSSPQTKASGQHTACEGASHGRRATGLAKTARAGRWVERIGSDGKAVAFSFFRVRRSL